jgi:hypothetical protein
LPARYTYNVKYVLGGSEKRVDAQWIISKDDNKAKGPIAAMDQDMEGTEEEWLISGHSLVGEIATRAVLDARGKQVAAVWGKITKWMRAGKRQ